MPGYDPDFLSGHHIPLPVPGPKAQAAAFNDGAFIHHSRMSILFNQDRRLATCVAHGIDGATLSEAQFTSRSFRFDPSIKPNALQAGDDAGYNRTWQRGHLAQRDSLSWGEEDDARVAERETDFFSNIAPQHKTLHHHAWGDIERWMMELAEDGDKRALAFIGPVFTDSDATLPPENNREPVRCPAGYWKILVIKKGGSLRAAGFLLWQRDYSSSEPLTFDPVLEQVRITTIEVLAGLSFAAIARFDPLIFEPEIETDGIEAFGGLESAGDIAPTRRAAPAMRPAAVKRAGDIII